MSSNHLVLCHLFLFLPSIFPSISIFSNESVLHIKCQSVGASASASVLPMNIQDCFPLGLTGFDFLVVQRTLKSLLQHHSSQPSVIRHSAFFIVQLSHPYMTTGKTMALTRQTFVGKVMSLLFNMLSRLVIAFLPRSNHLNFMAPVTICSDFQFSSVTQSCPTLCDPMNCSTPSHAVHHKLPEFTQTHMH